MRMTKQQRQEAKDEIYEILSHRAMRSRGRVPPGSVANDGPGRNRLHSRTAAGLTRNFNALGSEAEHGCAAVQQSERRILQ